MVSRKIRWTRTPYRGFLLIFMVLSSLFLSRLIGKPV
jgi:hypothetical protein